MDTSIKMLAFALIAIIIVVIFIAIAVTYGLIPGLKISDPNWIENILSAGG